LAYNVGYSDISQSPSAVLATMETADVAGAVAWEGISQVAAGAEAVGVAEAVASVAEALAERVDSSRYRLREPKRRIESSSRPGSQLRPLPARLLTVGG
jgi:hypothetical protein